MVRILESSGDLSSKLVAVRASDNGNFESKFPVLCPSGTPSSVTTPAERAPERRDGPPSKNLTRWRATERMAAEAKGLAATIHAAFAKQKNDVGFARPGPGLGQTNEPVNFARSFQGSPRQLKAAPSGKDL